MANELTVFDALKHLFPVRRGGGPGPYPPWPLVQGYPRRRKPRSRLDLPINKPYAATPLTPFDVFAASAHLLEISGAYHHIVPMLEPDQPERPGRAERLVRITHKEIRICRRVARRWRSFPWDLSEKLSDEEKDFRMADWMEELLPLHDTWDELFGKHGAAPVYSQVPPDEPPPAWWPLAVRLMIMADEAASHVGFTPLFDLKHEGHWFEEEPYKEIIDRFIAWDKKHERPSQVLRPLPGSEKGEEADIAPDVEFNEFITSLSNARRDIACVLPKARTTAVGCTMRSLSHHLALLPARGIARANWIPHLFYDPPADEQEFNILLVPYPFSIADYNFRGLQGFAGIDHRWGFFEVEQAWLETCEEFNAPASFVDRLASFVAELAQDAIVRHGANHIDAVIFPELSLNYAVFRGIERKLQRLMPTIELLIAGLRDDGKKRKGNFVGVSVFNKTEDPEEPFIIANTREKHHRWRLDRSQIKEAYRLKGVLNPQLDWWEDIDLLSRRVDFTVFRKSSVLAAMICEDLARVDPCQELIRAIGPNIVVALLMDAPQLATRWPARYATTLADDPGAAVLTLTSRAMMTLQHLNGAWTSEKPDDRVIALWRDDRSPRLEQIACPYDAHGVWLKVWGARVTDLSIDGRDDPTAVAWTYGTHKSLIVKDVDRRYPDIVGEADRKVREAGVIRGA